MSTASRRGRFELQTVGPFRAGARGALSLVYAPAVELQAGRRLWLMYDIRQRAGAPQAEDMSGPNLVTARLERGGKVSVTAYGARTLDLYPQVPEFLHVCELNLVSGMARGEELTIELGGAGWEFPKRPIGDFSFWLIEGQPGQVFAPTGYKTYRTFDPVPPSDILSAGAAFEGEHPGPTPENRRPTPGILWGDLHGMAFNQRPLDDFYEYARAVAGFDFAAAMLFSYNVCVGDMWDHVKETAARFTCPGEFVAVPGIEFGTPPDGSHRNAHFFLHPERVPPILFEERPPALEPRLTDRFHADTIRCRDLEHFYETVAAYGGMVSGHFHTLRYEREHLAEMWQKQSGSAQEEERIFGLLSQGMRLGLVGGSDTHDSMPGNPAPEPGCPQAAGFMAVLADEVTPQALREAVMERRVYATTGARIVLRVDASGHAMGSAVRAETPRVFRVEAEGSAPLAAVELVRQGEVVDTADPSGVAWEGTLADPGDEIDPSGAVRDETLSGQGVGGMRADPAWYLIRVTQTDGHRAWSSPVWFE